MLYLIVGHIYEGGKAYEVEFIELDGNTVAVETFCLSTRRDRLTGRKPWKPCLSCIERIIMNPTTHRVIEGQEMLSQEDQAALLLHAALQPEECSSYIITGY